MVHRMIPDRRRGCKRRRRPVEGHGSAHVLLPLPRWRPRPFAECGPGSSAHGGAAVSEYQYYEFRAIDTPLDERDMAALRAISSRAEITPTSLTNVYHWGDFKGDPDRLMDRYFVLTCTWPTGAPAGSCCGCPRG